MVMADMDTEDTEVMEDMDTEVTMARDLLMLSQDIMVMEDMDMVDTEVMEVMDMVADTTDKKLVHTIQFKAINHKFYFKTDSFSQLSKLLNKRIFFWIPRLLLVNLSSKFSLIVYLILIICTWWSYLTLESLTRCTL